jgi:hypothetical protein
MTITNPTSRTNDLNPISGVETASPSTENLLNRVVLWIHEDRPLYQQFLVHTGVALFAITCVISVLGIPLAWKLSQKIDQAHIQDRMHKSDMRVFDAIGGFEKYNQLSQLKIEGSFNEDSLVHSATMTNSLMRGTLNYNRPFFAMKLSDLFHGRNIAIVVYRQYTHEPTWNYTKGDCTPFTGSFIDDSALQTIESIVKGTHEQYRLA